METVYLSMNRLLMSSLLLFIWTSATEDFLPTQSRTRATVALIR